MSTTKITALPSLATANISANGAQTIFVVVDTSSGTPTTKQMSLQSLDSFVDNVGPIALAHATGAFEQANTANTSALAAFTQANAANSLAQTAFVLATTANAMAFGAYASANTNTTDIGTLNTTISTVWTQANTTANTVANTDVNVASTLVVAQAAFDAANAETIGTAAYDQANSANVLAQAAYDAANTNGATFNSGAYDHANGAFDVANTASNTATGGFTHANAAFDKANSANVVAQAAYDTANTANSTDYTTISITAGEHGNGTFVPVITVTANGRISTISNTAITGFANATYTQAAFDQANTANTTAVSGYNQANTGTTLAQAAYDYANTISGASGSFISWVGNTANSAFAHANGSFVTSNAALTLSAQAFNQGNTGVIVADAAFAKANAANVLAQAAYDTANTANTTANIVTFAYTHANAAFNVANSAAGVAQSAYTQANTGTTLAQAAFDQANTASVINTQSQAAFDQANTASNTAIGAFTHANSAYDIANTALATAAIAINFDNYANAAYDQANSATTLAQNAYNYANTVNSYAEVIEVNAQAAFDRSNTNLTSIEIGIYPKLNSAYDQANTANSRAYQSVQKGGDTMFGTLAITTNAIIGLTVTSNTSNAVGGATNPVVEMTGKANNYIQTYLFNETNEKYSSADFVVYPHNGNDANGWVDVGITSSTFDYPTFSITEANEGYIFMSAPGGSGTSGNLIIATDSTGSHNAIEFFVGGFAQDKANVKVKIDTVGLTANTLSTNTFIQFPNGTTLNTANVLIFRTSAPDTNKGSAGDKIGYVYLANNYFYYCTADYDGTTNVWSRIASSDAW